MQSNFKLMKFVSPDYSSAIPRDSRGACFVVDPSSTPLLPFHSHTLTITAHSDMWGEYKDELVCEVCMQYMWRVYVWGDMCAYLTIVTFSLRFQG